MIDYIKKYPAILEEDERGASLYFPDLPGCVSAGDTMEETLENASEALALHIAGLIEDGIPAPEADWDKAKREAKASGSLLVAVEPDRLILSHLVHGRSKRISATIDEYVLELSEKYLRRHNVNRSKLFEKVLLGVATNRIPLETIMDGKNG